MISANQVGKTYAASMEVSMHCCNIYPDWWRGYRFDRPITAWCCGETSEVVRATIQRLLLGEPHGTGAIPKDALVEVTPARGLADLVDTIRVRSGDGISTIALKAYSQGKERFVGATIDLVWADEEPDESIFGELITRRNIANGPMLCTFTPLKGLSTVVKRFLRDNLPDHHTTVMTIWDAEHYDDAARERILSQYDDWERDTRTKGVPMMGSGRVFLIDDAKLLIDPVPIGTHWLQLGGLDPGWEHPAGFAHIAWDRDEDVIYLIKSIRLRHQTPLQHVKEVRPWNLVWAWPSDGGNRTLAGAGISLVQQYIDGGLDCLPEKATFSAGGVSVEAGIAAMHDRSAADASRYSRAPTIRFLKRCGPITAKMAC
jgi:phage terminase large subunit-like protein